MSFQTTPFFPPAILLLALALPSKKNHFGQHFFITFAQSFRALQDNVAPFVSSSDPLSSGSIRSTTIRHPPAAASCSCSSARSPPLFRALASAESTASGGGPSRNSGDQIRSDQRVDEAGKRAIGQRQSTARAICPAPMSCAATAGGASVLHSVLVVLSSSPSRCGVDRSVSVRYSFIIVLDSTSTYMLIKSLVRCKYTAA